MTTTHKLRRGAAAGTMAGSPRKGADVPRPPKEPDTSTYNGRVAARLRELRAKRGLSVEALMDNLAQHGLTVNRSLVYAWENGSKLVHPNHYPAIAAALGCKSVRQFLPDD